MASNLSPAFAYTVLYVKDVARSIAFYSKAFGYAVRRLDESHRYISVLQIKTKTKYIGSFSIVTFFMLLDGQSWKRGPKQSFSLHCTNTRPMI